MMNSMRNRTKIGAESLERLWNGRSPRVCVIGGGISGLAVTAALEREGVFPILVEKQPELGGVWKRHPHFSVYPGLQQNTAASSMMFDGLPGQVPSKEANYTREEYATYVSFSAEMICAHATRFMGYEVHAVRQRARDLEAEISATMDPANRFILSADHMIIACGATARPFMPDVLGIDAFIGPVLHSSTLRDPLSLRDLDILLVGFGNTAADLAVRMTGIAGSVTISARNPTWVLPRSLNGMSTDSIARELYAEYGADFSRAIYRTLQNRAHCVGAVDEECIDYRTHRIVTCTDLIPLLKSNQVRISGGLASIAGNVARFADGSVKRVDAIIFCTGYVPEPPALPVGREVGLIGNILDRQIRGLWFAGLTPIWGSAAEIARLQAAVISRAIARAISAPALMSLIAELPRYPTIGDPYGPGLNIVEFNTYAAFLRQLSAALPDSRPAPSREMHGAVWFAARERV